jgi:hypothetical protein
MPPRSPRSLEAGGGGALIANSNADAAAGFANVRLSVAVPPSPYRSNFSAATATGTSKKDADVAVSAQNSSRATEGGVRIVFKVRRERASKLAMAANKEAIANAMPRAFSPFSWTSSSLFAT